MAKRTKILPGHELKLTSFKYHPHVMAQFQEQSLNLISLQSLANRAMDLFVKSKEFRNVILSHTELLPSGSL